MTVPEFGGPARPWAGLSDREVLRRASAARRSEPPGEFCERLVRDCRGPGFRESPAFRIMVALLAVGRVGPADLLQGMADCGWSADERLEAAASFAGELQARLQSSSLSSSSPQPTSSSSAEMTAPLMPSPRT